MAMEELSSCSNHSDSPPLSTVHSNGRPAAVKRNITKNNMMKDSTFDDDPHASSSSSSAASLPKVKLLRKRKSSKVSVATATRRHGCVNCNNVGTAALPLGMSVAAFVAQVLEKNKTSDEHLNADELSSMCASAVRESLSNVFGRKYDAFSRNFEMSFSSTLRTLRLINGYPQRGDSVSEGIEMEDSIHDIDEQHGSETSLIVQPSSSVAISANQLSTVEQCIVEQTRSNDLKALEIGLTMRKLKLKEAQLALTYDSNHLERSKLAMGVSKASFKAEKFKSHLEETKHGEFLKKMMDCIIASLIIMLSFLCYGAYAFSYQRIIEATAACSSVAESSKSWWFPKQITAVNSAWLVLRCQAQALSRMTFGMFMIVAIAYLLVQRGGEAKQAMPVTFFLLLLGVFCGFSGKICVDTLAGSGWFWFSWWEVTCLIYFSSVVFPSPLFECLYGSVEVGAQNKPTLMRFPFWLRRMVFFGFLLCFLPVCCGLLPFAGIYDWMDHLLLLSRSLWLVIQEN